MEIQLRPYQTECVEKVVSQFKNFWAFLTSHTREAITASETLQQELKQLQTALVVLPTGGGKTVIFATIEIQIRQFLATRQKNLSTLILAHRQELLNQARDKYHMIDASQLIGLVGGGIAEYGAPVTVASIATVSQKNHLKNLKNFGYGLVIVDESHHVAAAGYQTVLDVLPWSFRLFVTATPDRLDGKPIVDHEPIYSAYITDMVKEGFLTNILPILVRTKTQLDKIKTTGGDYNEHELEIAIDNPERNRRIVEAYQEYASGRPFLCFSVTVAHAEHIAEAFREAGIAVEAISGRMTSEERVRTLQAFESGKLQGLVNCLDTQTEILTRRGWVNHETIRPDDITATFNTATQTVEWQPISRIVKRERASEERMVHIKNQLLDIRVTEGHRMLIKAPGAHSWKFVEAGTLPTRQGPYQIPTASIAPTERQKDLPSPLAQPKSTCNRQLSVLSYNYRKQGATPERALELAKATMEHRSSLRTKPVAELTLDECRFIGLWITDGHIDRSKGQRGIQITQSGRYKEANLEIQRILTSCGFDWKHGTTTNAKTPHLIHRYDIPRGVIGGQLARKGYAHLEYYLEKDFHPDLFGLNQKQTHALVEGLWLGDGYKEAHRKDFYAYRTSYQVSKTNLAYLERMQTLATLRGFAATLSKPIYNGPQSTKPIYNLRIRRRDTITTNNHTIPTSGGNPARFETNWQPETVWCVTNQNGTIVTRRNGKIAIMGQCGILTEGYDNPSTSCIILARPTKSRALVVQKIGRGLRLAPGKSDCVVLDITDNILNHRLQPVTLSQVIGKELRDQESLLDMLAREEEEEEKRKASESDDPKERKIKQKQRDKDIVLNILQRFDWKRNEHGYWVVEVGALKHRIALIPAKDAPGMWKVAARLAPAYEQQWWSKRALPLDWAQNFAESEALKIRDDPKAVKLVDRNATWRLNPPSEEQMAFLDKHHVAYPTDEEGHCMWSRGEASEAIGKKIEQFKKRRESKQKVTA